MRTGIVISSAGHAAILAWTLLAFSAKPFNAAPVESLPVDIISVSDFSRITAGAKTAPKAEAPKPLVDKIGEPSKPKEPAPKIAEKPEIEATKSEPAPPPVPTPKPAEAKAEKKEPEPKVDQIAEALSKDTSKPQPPKPQQVAVQTPVPIKKPPPPQPKFDANKIAALLDKRDPQRQAATGSMLNSTASLGLPTASAATLSQNEIDALRARLAQCWNPPAGVADAKELSVLVRIQLTQNGALAAEPLVTNRSANPLFQVAAESALRAVQRCAPFAFLPAAKYDVWRDLEVNFDPRDMFRG